jgi:hypothetical protein
MKDLRQIAPPAYVAPSAWTEHVPFALWVMDQINPRIFVELGTHYGMSYFAFCQAISAAGLSTKAFAVDTWQGDDHAGFYSEEVFDRVSGYNTNHYAGFSSLLRMTFAEAVAQFEDDSVDFLHIDGRHSYEDVKADFESWLPKLSNRAVVLFHDTEVRTRDFGVYRLWAELEEQYPSFNFLHGHGLGVLGVGKNLPKALKPLFSLRRKPEDLAFFQSVFEGQGAGLVQRLIVDQQLAAAQTAVAPVQLPKVKLVIATKIAEADFFEKTATGRSIVRLNFDHLNIRLFCENTVGLPQLYNIAIEETAGDPCMLVFMHDDLNILSFDWVAQLAASTAHFHLTGLVGNTRRLPRQPSWYFTDTNWTRDTPGKLSGTVAHGKSYPPDTVDYFGPAPQKVALLDGLLLCGLSTTFLDHGLRFDERFGFHFYDMDLCRTAAQKNLTCGTWPVSVIHESPGNFSSGEWQNAYVTYLEKWGD